MADTSRPLGIFYEHPDWYRPLFDELDRRGVPHDRLHADEHRFDPSVPDRYAVVLNRMSPSAYTRGRAHLIFYTSQWLAHLERQGVRVINGTAAWRRRDLQGVPGDAAAAARAAVAAHAGHPPRRPGADAADGLRFPVIVKPNIGGSGAGIRRFDTRAALADAAADGPARSRHRQRGARAGVHPRRRPADRPGRSAERAVSSTRSGSTPPATASTCARRTSARTSDGAELARPACAVDAPKNNLRVEAYTPPRRDHRTPSSASRPRPASRSAASST